MGGGVDGAATAPSVRRATGSPSTGQAKPWSVMTPSGSVSVVIPTYNRASWLGTTLTSVFAQTYPVTEVLLLDDGSTDNTREVVDALLAAHPDWRERLHYRYQDNRGKSAALNAAVPLARCEWIAFNDSDDTWLPDKLELQFRALSQYPECDACFTESSLLLFQRRHPKYFESGTTSMGKVAEPSWLFIGDWPGIYMQTLVVRRRTLEKFGEFDCRYRLSQDVDFLFQLGLLTPFCYVNRPLVEIDRDPQRAMGLTTSFPAKSLTAMLEGESMRHKWLSLVDRSHGTLGAAIRHQLASTRSALANRYLITGELQAARTTLREGLRDCPEARLLIKWMLTYTTPALLRRIVSRRVPVEFLRPA
jgi:hypothetical protein